MTDTISQDSTWVQDDEQWMVSVMRWVRASEDQERWIGQELEAISQPDRELALAVAHHLLDKHATEAVGQTAVEVAVLPPKQTQPKEKGFKDFDIPPEVLAKARKLGIKGDTEAQVKRMAKRAAPYSQHPKANRRFQNYAFKIENGTVAWIGRIAENDRR